MNYDQEILFRLKLAKVDDIVWAKSHKRAIFWANAKGWIVPGACLAMALVVLAQLIGGR